MHDLSLEQSLSVAVGKKRSRPITRVSTSAPIVRQPLFIPLFGSEIACSIACGDRVFRSLFSSHFCGLGRTKYDCLIADCGELVLSRDPKSYTVPLTYSTYPASSSSSALLSLPSLPRCTPNRAPMPRTEHPLPPYPLCN